MLLQVFDNEFDFVVFQGEQGVVFVDVDVFVSVDVGIVLMDDDVVSVDYLVVINFDVQVF